MITKKHKNKQQVRNIYLSLCSEIKTLFTNSTKVELNSENDIIYIYIIRIGGHPARFIQIFTYNIKACLASAVTNFHCVNTRANVTGKLNS